MIKKIYLLAGFIFFGNLLPASAHYVPGEAGKFCGWGQQPIPLRFGLTSNSQIVATVPPQAIFTVQSSGQETTTPGDSFPYWVKVSYYESTQNITYVGFVPTSFLCVPHHDCPCNE